MLPPSAGACAGYCSCQLAWWDRSRWSWFPGLGFTPSVVCLSCQPTSPSHRTEILRCLTPVMRLERSVKGLGFPGRSRMTGCISWSSESRAPGATRMTPGYRSAKLLAGGCEQVFPDRKVLVDVRTDGGVVLEQAVLRLLELERHPDAIIVFAGHNEFQGR